MLLPEGIICGRLTEDLPLGCLQGEMALIWARESRWWWTNSGEYDGSAGSKVQGRGFRFQIYGCRILIFGSTFFRCRVQSFVSRFSVFGFRFFGSGLTWARESA